VSDTSLRSAVFWFGFAVFGARALAGNEQDPLLDFLHTTNEAHCGDIELAR
jgi:hypothetical protein